VNTTGALLVLVAAAAYAFYLTLSQWYLGDYPPQTVALYVISLMALVTTAARLLQFEPWQPLSPSGWGVVLATALFSTVLARLAIFAGIQRIGSGQTALLGMTETFLTVLWAMLFLGERLSPIQWGGGILIVGSAMLSARHRPQPATR
jgi:drug/metabolite transporter (DMT)-like permease